ncbi:MAG: hypothetical protein ACE5OP_02165 [Candidatus Glassbacteria bacterium]
MKPVGRTLVSVIIIATVILISAIAYKAGIFTFSLSTFSKGSVGGEFRFPKHRSNVFIPDETAGHVHKTNTRLEITWTEHPEGSIFMSSNNLGFREDEDTPVSKPPDTYRILVTGDSHIDGFINNSESFPNRLEILLNKKASNQRYEVLNGATSHYGPYNYLGFMKKYSYLEPDMFVVVLYTGNDFGEALQTAELRGLIKTKERSEAYNEKLKSAASVNPGAVYQAVNQIYFFKTFPDMKEKALDVVESQLAEIQELCMERNIPFWLVCLPTKCDVEWEKDSDRLDEVRRILNLSGSDLLINQRVTEELTGRLDRYGVISLNVIDRMREPDEELYWKRDYHLNHRGHERLAEIFSEELIDYLNRSVSHR